MTQVMPAQNLPGTMMAGMVMSNVVRLVNESDRPFSMKYGPRDRLTLEVGQSVFVNEEVAWHYLGKWWTSNANPKNRERVSEVRRLRALYGAYEDDAAWNVQKPGIVAYTADGQRITTVVDDPDGVLSGAQTPLSTQHSLEAQVQVLQSQLLQLTALIGAQHHQEASDGQAMVPADMPPSPTAPAFPVAPGPTLATFPGLPAVPVAPPLVAAPEAVDGMADGMIAEPIGSTPRVQPEVVYDPATDAEPGDVPTDHPTRVRVGGKK